MTGAIRAVGWGRAAVGVVATLAPDVMIRVGDGEPSAAARHLCRLFGVREIVLGLVTVRADADALERLVPWLVATDSADALAVVVGKVRGDVTTKAMVTGLPVAVGAAVLQAIAARR